MVLGADCLRGRVTLVGGPGKASGKTTLLKHCLGLLREAGEVPAFLAVGFEGEGRDSLTGGLRPCLEVRPGEVVLTAESSLSATSCEPEILEVLPGATALGRPVLIRARRPGSVVLVGPERNEYAALAVSLLREADPGRPILIDGALSRISQASAIPGLAFLQAYLVGPGDLPRAVGRLLHLERLLGLEEAPGACPAGVFDLEGPLTRAVAEGLPEGVEALRVADLTRVFLEGAELSAFLRGRPLLVTRSLPFLGHVVTLRGLAEEVFLSRLTASGAGAATLGRVGFNPYRAGRAA